MIDQQYKIAYERELNEEQLGIVSNLEGKMLILAGAGSGKTRTLTYSVAKLIESGIDPKSILLVTFTNKAAGEMKSRVEELLGKMPLITAGTFHSIANRFLKKFSYKIKLPNYSILNNTKALQLFKRCINEACFNELDTNPDYARYDDDQLKEILGDLKKRYPGPKEIQEIVSTVANTEKTLPKVIDWKYPDLGSKFDEINEIMNRYREIKTKEVLLDFDDLLYFWDTILDDNDVKEYASRYKFILVDEFQDTNHVQNSIIEKLIKLNLDSFLLVVGDDSQSIYAFRGADIKKFLNFGITFPGSKKFEITTNYRSTPEILSLANNSIKKNKNQYQKEMTAANQSGESVRYIITENNKSQIKYLYEKIEEIHEKGVPYNKIALLFRALKGTKSEITSINKLMLMLTKANIPYEVRGGQSFFEKAHIRDVLAFLEFRFNPKNIFAKENWTRIAKRYISGLGPINSEKIYELILKKIENPMLILTQDTLLRQRLRQLRVKKKIRKINPNIIHNISLLFNRVISEKDSNVGAIIKNIMIFRPVYKAFEARYKTEEDDENFKMRKEDIKILIEMASNYPTIGEFLNIFALNESEVNDLSKGKKKNSRLIISTIHRAKGLEWDYVFIPMLSNGYFPDFKSIDKEEELEEERRVFYVALTRARLRLFLLSSSTNTPSLFLTEIDSNLYELDEC